MPQEGEIRGRGPGRGRGRGRGRGLGRGRGQVRGRGEGRGRGRRMGPEEERQIGALISQRDQNVQVLFMMNDIPIISNSPDAIACSQKMTFASISINH